MGFVCDRSQLWEQADSLAGAVRSVTRVRSRLRVERMRLGCGNPHIY